MVSDVLKSTKKCSRKEVVLTSNVDTQTVEGFGEEWSKFDHHACSAEALETIFNQYFSIFPWAKLPTNAVGFDLGCGSGRWAQRVAPRVGTLHCIDASAQALAVAQRNLNNFSNCHFHHASVDAIPLADNSMDFGYSLGVLHHVPNTLEGIRACVRTLKDGAPFLLYLYYALENRPEWFRQLWRCSNQLRIRISNLPFRSRSLLSELIAASIYWPFARSAYLFEKFGLNIQHMPLSAYRNASFYQMRNDALDRFGTRLEHRFTRDQIEKMMIRAGLTSIQFYENTPYWCALGYKTSL